MTKKLPFPVASHYVHTHYDRPLPKIIWMYWHDGEAAAPPLIQRCIGSWKHLNPGWQTRVLDSSSALDYANMSYLPEGVRLQLAADALRLELLHRYGGVWVDATCLCAAPLDDWLGANMQAGFFAFERPGPDRLLGNFFLASLPGNPLVDVWAEAARLYWKNGLTSNHLGITGRRDQFLYHYLFGWMVNKDPFLNSLWQAMPKIPAFPLHLLQQYLRDLESTENPPDWQKLAALMSTRDDVPLHKLDWRLSGSEGVLEDFERFGKSSVKDERI